MKNRSLFLFLLLPFLSFGDWYVFPYYWTSSSSSSPTGVYSSGCRSGGSSPIFSFFSYGPTSSPIWFGAEINSSNNVLIYPSLFAPRSALTNANKSVAHFIQDSSDNMYYHPCNFPDVIQLYEFASSLFLSGYRGKGLQDFTSSSAGAPYKFNFNPPLLFADVVTGTNSVFKAKLFDFLGSLSSGVNQLVINSDSALSSFRDFVSDYSSLNFYALSPTSAVVSSSSVLYDNPVFWFGSQSSYPFEDVVNSISQSLDLQDTSFPDASARRAFVSDALKSVLSDSLNAYLLDQSSGIDKHFQDYVTDPSMAQSVIAGHYSTPTTNAVMQGAKKISDDVRESLSNNTQRIKQQLADWHNFASNGVKEVNNNLSQIATSTSPTVLRSTLNGLDVNIQNSVGVLVEGPVNISESQVNSVTAPINGLRSDLSTWYNNWSDFYFSSSPDKGWVKFFDLFSEFKDVNHSDLASLSNSVFDAVSSISNLLISLDFDLKDNFPNLTNGNLQVSMLSFDSLLHEDYSNFVENSFFDILDNLKDHDPELWKSMVDLGLSDDPYSGRWWNLSAAALSQISVSVHSNMLMFSFLMSDVAAVDSFANDSLGMSPLSAARKIFDSFPSKTQIEDYISQCTNAASAVSVAGADLVSSFDAVSNSYVSIFKPFKGSFDSPGASVTFFKAANGDYVTIPVGNQSRAWLILRLGISFALVAVNILLLPKYILMLFTLFVRAYRIAIKFFPDDL